MRGWPGGIFDIAYNAFLAMDEEGRVLAWNARAEAIFGISAEQAVGRELARLVLVEPHRSQFREGVRSAAQTGGWERLGQRVEVSALRGDGSEFPAEITLALVPEDMPAAFVAVIA